MFNITYLLIIIYVLHIASLDKCLTLHAHFKAYLVLLQNANLLQGIQELDV